MQSGIEIVHSANNRNKTASIHNENDFRWEHITHSTLTGR